MTGLNWQLVGAPNARELGGLVGADGRRVRPGLLLRTPALGRLTDADLPVLGRLAPACVIDLRDDSEIAVAPADRLVGAPRVVHLPVFDPNHPVFRYVSAVLMGHDLGAYEGLGREGTPGAMMTIYRWLVTAAPARESFAEAVRLAAQPENLPLLFHCSAGKDRTGWLAVILLSVLGVAPEAIREDYLRSNERGESLQDVFGEAIRKRQPDLDEDSVRALLEVRAGYLDAAYDEVRRVYGSFEAYLRDGLGLTDEVFTALRTHLLE